MFHIKLIKSKVEKTNSKEDQRGKIKTKNGHILANFRYPSAFLSIYLVPFLYGLDNFDSSQGFIYTSR